MLTRKTSSTVSRRFAILASAGLLAVALAGPAGAQAPTTYTACYVPDVGAMYLIQLPGLPTECLSVSHLEISWTDGGTEVADGSITTIKLADGSVTTAKLVDLSVTSAKLANGAVTAAKLMSNSVSGIAVQDGSITAADLASNSVGTAELMTGSVTTPDIQNGAVTRAKIGSDVPLPPTTCSTNQIIKWSGSAWICSDALSITGWLKVQQTFFSSTGGTIYCPAGKLVLGGGFFSTTSSAAPVAASRPVQSGSTHGWSVVTGNADNWTVYAICADGSP